MKQINCNIIQDILPLYLDGVACEDTKELVKEHLQGCEGCRRQAERLQKDLVLPQSIAFQLAQAKVIKGLKRSFLKKKVLVALISALAAALLVAGLYSAAVLTKRCVSYDAGDISVVQQDGKLYAVYEGDLVKAGTVAFGPSPVTVDGEEKNVAVFYYYETPWDRYIEPLFAGAEDGSPWEGRFYLGEADQIDQVYYGEFQLDVLPLDADSLLGQAELIWGE